MCLVFFFLLELAGRLFTGKNTNSIKIDICIRAIYHMFANCYVQTSATYSSCLSTNTFLKDIIIINFAFFFLLLFKVIPISI